MYGFGAKPQYIKLKSDKVSHCFPLNGDNKNPSVEGVDGMLNCYDFCLRNCLFSGPTFFSPILE